MAILSAYAKFQELAETTDPAEKPELWALYDGLADLALGLSEELRQIKQTVERLK